MGYPTDRVSVATTTGWNTANQCTHCGCYHAGPCPRIKAIEYHENGMVKRVEYRDDYFIAPGPSA